MPRAHSSSHQGGHKPASRISVGRIAGWFALTAVLALSFIGYLTPHMQVQWANFMSMCGF
ncbi:MAG TPA: hypothetical protein VL001_02150 [Candidimonas sp.]|nr:hypothetical protein [Candidimonas sp.]